MSEIWRELPGSNGRYKISNYGNFARADEFANGVPLKLLERRSANTFKYSMRGTEKVLEINTMVSKVFGGFVCEGTECSKMACATCGHNPEIIEARKKHLANEGLTEGEGGLRYLALHNGV